MQTYIPDKSMPSTPTKSENGNGTKITGMRHPPSGAFGLPLWAGSIASRLYFWNRRRRGSRKAGRELAAVLTALRRAVDEPGGAEAALGRLLCACLTLIEEAVQVESDLAIIRDHVLTLCEIARAGLDGDPGAEGRLSVFERKTELPYSAPWRLVGAQRVPGRVLWLDAMVRMVPEEVPAAAIMLINDLCSIRRDYPLQVMKTAAHNPALTSVPPESSKSA